MDSKDLENIDLFTKERQDRLYNNQMKREYQEMEDSAWIIIWVAIMGVFWFSVWAIWKWLF